MFSPKEKIFYEMFARKLVGHREKGMDGPKGAEGADGPSEGFGRDLWRGWCLEEDMR